MLYVKVKRVNPMSSHNKEDHKPHFSIFKIFYLYGLSKLWELVMDWEAGVLQSMGLQRVGHD